MHFGKSVVSILVIFSVSAAGVGQQGTSSGTQRDPQAVSILERSLSASGGADSLGKIQDYVGSGTIVYYWAGEQLKGQVTVQGRGVNQFRVEASLPDGVREWAVTNGAGSLKETDGRKSPIPFHNTVNFGSLTLPAISVLDVLRNTSISISYLGLENRESGPAHHIRSQKTFAFDPNGIRSKLTTRDFFIDEVTLHVVATLDMVHPKNNSIEEYPHEVRFSDYRSVGGTIVPFSIVELYSGQHVSAIELTQIVFNQNLQDADFELN